MTHILRRYALGVKTSGPPEGSRVAQAGRAESQAWRDGPERDLQPTATHEMGLSATVRS